MHRYRARLSGPLLDRIDLHVEVPSLSYRELLAERTGEPSAAVRERVLAARQRQRARLRRAEGKGGGRTVDCNARMGPQVLRRIVRLNGSGKALLERAVDALGLSARAHDRALRVARTLADLDGTETVKDHHLAEAIHYRCLDRPAGES